MNFIFKQKYKIYKNIPINLLNFIFYIKKIKILILIFYFNNFYIKKFNYYTTILILYANKKNK